MRRYKYPEHAVLLLNRVISNGIDAHLVVVGTGPSLEHVKTAARYAGLEERVYFTGHVTDKELVRLLQSSRVNVQTSIAEGWCLSALEAAACGVPTIGYDVPGLNETVVDGNTGFLVPFGHIDALADAASRIIGGMVDLQRNCVQWSKQYDWLSSARAWNELCQQVSKESRVEYSRSYLT